MLTGITVMPKNGVQAATIAMCVGSLGIHKSRVSRLYYEACGMDNRCIDVELGLIAVRDNVVGVDNGSRPEVSLFSACVCRSPR